MATALLVAAVANAQTTGKEVDRSSRSEAKALEQEGWAVMQGNPPLAQQLAESRRIGQEVAADDAKRYFTATSTGSAGNYTAAKQIADCRAREELAESIHNAITRKINDRAATSALDSKDIDAIKEYVSASRSLILSQLQDVSSVIEIYREKGKTCEVKVQLKVDAAQALKNAGRTLQNDLSNRSPSLAAGLVKLL